MKLFRYLVIVLLLISTGLSGESSDLNQYKIELIIDKEESCITKRRNMVFNLINEII